MCLTGARAVLDDIAKAYPDADAKFFVVWAPMLGTDSRNDAVSQSQTFEGDDRFKFYWDEKKKLPNVLGSNMQLPGDREQEQFFDSSKDLLNDQEQESIRASILNRQDDHQLAWDIYLLYDKDVTWGSKPPEPSFWMHQLGDDGRTLDPARLKLAFESMIDPKHEIVFFTREGCVGTPTMRVRLEEALRKKGLPEAFQIIDMDEVDEDDVRTGYGTPTVLVDGSDLMGAAVPEEPAVPT